MSIPTDGDNPFAPPSAAVLEPAPQGPNRFVAEGRRVAASRGFSWFGEAWDLFMRAPGTWIGMFVAFAVAWIVFSIIPLGGLVVSACYPIIAAGIMLGCRDLEQGKALTFGHLFAGFGPHAGKLLGVGLIYLAGVVLIGFLVGIGMALAVPMIVRSGSHPDLTGILAIAPIMLLVALVAVALSLPLIMALWFAPAIVIFNGGGSMAAMKSSFHGCLKNFVPFLLYGIAGFVFAVLAALPVGLGFLVLGPVLWATMYTGYRDIFEPGD